MYIWCPHEKLFILHHWVLHLLADTSTKVQILAQKLEEQAVLSYLMPALFLVC
jgi:hypothetical protein